MMGAGWILDYIAFELRYPFRPAMLDRRGMIVEAIYDLLPSVNTIDDEVNLLNLGLGVEFTATPLNTIVKASNTSKESLTHFSTVVAKACTSLTDVLEMKSFKRVGCLSSLLAVDTDTCSSVNDVCKFLQTFGSIHFGPYKAEMALARFQFAAEPHLGHVIIDSSPPRVHLDICQTDVEPNDARFVLDRQLKVLNEILLGWLEDLPNE